MHYVIAGLGNPGPKYDGTRHNIGFDIVDRFAWECDARFRPGKGEFYCARTVVNQADVCLVKPTTFMNNCGLAVKEVIESFEGSRVKLIVVCDDFYVPLGQLRIRKKGSSGGHNGLASVIEYLGTKEFTRIRCGIRSEPMPDDEGFASAFVLARFEEPELPIVSELVGKACQALKVSVIDGIEEAMNRFNESVLK